jgi:hypothetical protein
MAITQPGVTIRKKVGHGAADDDGEESDEYEVVRMRSQAGGRCAWSHAGVMSSYIG